MRNKAMQRDYVEIALKSFCKTLSEQYNNLSYGEKTAMGPYGPEQVSPKEFCSNVMALASFLYEEPYVNTAANTLPIVLPMVEEIYRISIPQNVTDLAILSVLQAPGFTDQDVLKMLDDPKRFESFLQKKRDLVASIDQELYGHYSYRMFQEKMWSLQHDHEYPVLAECRKQMGENELLALCKSPSKYVRRQLARQLPDILEKQPIENAKMFFGILSKDEDFATVGNVVLACSDPEILKSIAERGTGYPYTNAQDKLAELEKSKDSETEEGKEIE